MTRKEYLVRQKEDSRIIFGVFPGQYPKELLWAMNILPAEIWDPPMEPVKANSHLQPYICSVVKSGLELIVQGNTEFIDGFLFPHTCDSIQNMASVVHDYIGLDKPCYFFYPPKEPHSKAAQKYYIDQTLSLVRVLETRFGPLDRHALERSLALGEQTTELLTELYEKRASRVLSSSNREFYSVVRKGEYMWPEDHIVLLKDYLNKTTSEQKSESLPVIISGVLPNPPELLDLLDELDIEIVHDDLLSCSRRLLVPKSPASDPFGRLKDKYFAMPPCTTKGSSISKRKEFLLKLIEQTGAKGIIFNIVKFCEPEWFDLPNLVDELKKKNIPTLVLDTELNQRLPGQVVTRIEAFREML